MEGEIEASHIGLRTNDRDSIAMVMQQQVEDHDDDDGESKPELSEWQRIETDNVINWSATMC